MRKFLTILLLTFWAGSLLAQDEVQVTGIITDPASNPLPAVSITIKDQPGLGIASNAEGEYKIKVDPYSILVFSYIGY
ncbi:MAG TPA: carboxypeptidase-like regulatory domain-containing protein, partial [Niabella sp.]|nr:carboxypeptidase-like regulatory domain-containing protein [Niabella sp.]